MLLEGWNGIDLPLLAMLFTVSCGFEESIRDSCHRCFFHKLLWENDILQKWFTTVLSSLGETKYAHHPGQMDSRSVLHFSHNGIQVHDIQLVLEVDFRTQLANVVYRGICSKYAPLSVRLIMGEGRNQPIIQCLKLKF